MVMGKKKFIGCCRTVLGDSYDHPIMPEDQQKSEYKKRYEFNKVVPVRSPVDGWEYSHLNENEYPYSPKKEVALVKGTPHRFKAVRTGSVYGNRKSVVRSK